MSEEWQFDEKNPKKLMFSHGMECELAMLDVNGQLPSGDTMLQLFKKIVENAHRSLVEILQSDYCPKLIKKKLVGLPQLTYTDEKGDVVVQTYKIGNKEVTIEIFGRDGNVASITYILEVVTPPCTHLDELTWWLKTLFTVAEEVMVPSNLYLLSTGIPSSIHEYLRGLSYADHHHMNAFKDDLERKKIYNMFRNFIPHLIALSVNSPLINGMPSDDVKVMGNEADPKAKLRYAAPGCLRSIRLKNNVSMLSRNDPRVFIPWLGPGPEYDQNYFCQVIQKASLEDAKFQDLFPFSDWGTIEFRIFDAPLSINKRIGFAILLQALALKARKLDIVPDVGSYCLVANRKQAIERGLFGSFRTDQILDIADKEFKEYYIGNPPHKYAFQAIQGMLKYITPELKELKFINKKLYKKTGGISPFLIPIFLSVFGDVDLAMAPFGDAEFQLLLYRHYAKKNPGVPPGPQILQNLIKLTFKASKDPLFNPIGGQLDFKKTLKWLKV
ncbi:MAG: hypothetical protein ACXQS8_04015 [Candidatus Helarchaeales archaeon]